MTRSWGLSRATALAIFLSQVLLSGPAVANASDGGGDPAGPGEGYSFIIDNRDTGSDWWRAPYLFKLPYAAGFGWGAGDRIAYGCIYGFLIQGGTLTNLGDSNSWDLTGGTIYGRFLAALTVPEDGAYLRINDGYMVEGRRFFDGSPGDGRDQLYSSGFCADQVSQNYEEYAGAGERPIIKFHSPSGDVAEIRDYRTVNADIGVKFRLVDGDGSDGRVAVVAYKDGLPGVVVYYDALNGGSVSASVADERVPDICPSGRDCDRVIFQDSAGQWHRWETISAPRTTTSFFFGNPGDLAFSGDWDCDGVDTPGLYRQSDGFVYLRNSNTQGIADIRFFFGNPRDVPLAGDFDGDGCDTVSIYRPAEQRVYVINELGDGDRGLGAADHSYLFGNPGDRPFAGDFDGDRIDTVGLHRASTGLVYYRNTNTTGLADAQFVFGDPGDLIAAGDWIGAGHDTVAAYRRSTQTIYIRYSNSAGNANVQLFAGPQTGLAAAH